MVHAEATPQFHFKVGLPFSIFTRGIQRPSRPHTLKRLVEICPPVRTSAKSVDVYVNNSAYARRHRSLPEFRKCISRSVTYCVKPWNSGSDRCRSSMQFPTLSMLLSGFHAARVVALGEVMLDRFVAVGRTSRALGILLCDSRPTAVPEIPPPPTIATQKLWPLSAMGTKSPPRIDIKPRHCDTRSMRTEISSFMHSAG